MRWQKSRVIPGTNGLYKLSYYGVLRKWVDGKWIKPKVYTSKSSHRRRVKIKVEGYSRSVHYIAVLMAITFLDHEPNGHTLVVDHKNNISFDDRLSNLQVIENKENLTKDRIKKPNFGVYEHDDKWQVKTRICGVVIYFGIFESFEIAIGLRDFAIANEHLFDGDETKFRKQIINLSHGSKQ